MDALRANEKLVELHGESAEAAGGVKDWQADRLARSLAQMEALFDQALTLQKANGPVSADVAHPAVRARHFSLRPKPPMESQCQR